MPVLQRERATYTHKRAAQRALPRTEEQSVQVTSIEQSIGHLRDAFHACLGNHPAQIIRPATAGMSELIDLAKTSYFQFSRIICRDDHLFAALGSRWYYKLELIAKLAVAIQQFAVAQALNLDDDRLRKRWSESLSIAFMSECLSRSVGSHRPSEAWVAGTVMSVLGFAEACRAIAGDSLRSVTAISHLDAREPVLTLANLDRLTRGLELGQGFSISRAVKHTSHTSPWPQVAAACYVEIVSRRNEWVAELAAGLERTPLSAPVQHALSLRSPEIADMSREIALISWNAASKSGAE